MRALPVSFEAFTQRCASCGWRGVSRARRLGALSFVGGVAGVLVVLWLGEAGVLPSQPIPVIAVAFAALSVSMNALVRRESCPACGSKGLK